MNETHSRKSVLALVLLSGLLADTAYAHTNLHDDYCRQEQMYQFEQHDKQRCLPEREETVTEQLSDEANISEKQVKKGSSVRAEALQAKEQGFSYPLVSGDGLRMLIDYRDDGGIAFHTVNSYEKYFRNYFTPEFKAENPHTIVPSEAFAPMKITLTEVGKNTPSQVTFKHDILGGQWISDRPELIPNIPSNGEVVVMSGKISSLEKIESMDKGIVMEFVHPLKNEKQNSQKITDYWNWLQTGFYELPAIWGEIEGVEPPILIYRSVFTPSSPIVVTPVAHVDSTPEAAAARSYRGGEREERGLADEYESSEMIHQTAKGSSVTAEYAPEGQVSDEPERAEDPEWKLPETPPEPEPETETVQPEIPTEPAAPTIE